VKPRLGREVKKKAAKVIPFPARSCSPAVDNIRRRVEPTQRPDFFDRLLDYCWREGEEIRRWCKAYETRRAREGRL